MSTGYYRMGADVPGKVVNLEDFFRGVMLDDLQLIAIARDLKRAADRKEAERLALEAEVAATIKDSPDGT
jgi:hypothetical protein